MVSCNKGTESFAQFHSDEAKFQLFILLILSDRAEVKGVCPATTVLSGHKLALFAGTVLSAVASGPLYP